MMEIFLSRPTWVAPGQRAGLDNFLSLLRTLELHPRTLGIADYASRCPLDEVIALMDKCRGAIILGYPQLVMTGGQVKGADLVGSVHLSTEWNHIEAGLAYARNLPLLVVHHTGVGRGIFDKGSIKNFLHEVDFADASWPLANEITGTLTRWKDVVELKAASERSNGQRLRRPLIDSQLQVLQQFGQPRIEQLSAHAIARSMSVSDQRAEYLLDQLCEDDLLGRMEAPGGPTLYFLQPAGRSALVESGLLFKGDYG
jgi:hypothetical protein